MAGYIKATYRAGPVTVVERYYSPRYGVRAGRGQREKPTPERVAEVNERRSEFKLWLTLLVAVSIIIIPTQSFRIPHSLCLKNSWLPLLSVQF